MSGQIIPPLYDGGQVDEMLKLAGDAVSKAAHLADIDQIKHQMAGISSSVVLIQSDVGKIKSDINVVQDDVTALNTAVSAISQQLGELASRVTSAEDSIAITNDTLATHRNGDVARWQELSNLKADFYTLKNSIASKVLDTANTEDIEDAAQGDGYTVSNVLGGRVSFEAVIILIAIVPQQIFVNGIKIWDSAGLGLGTLRDSVEVEAGDVVTCSGMTSITFTPYITA